MSFPREAIARLVGQLGRVQCVWADSRASSMNLGATGGPQAWIELAVTNYAAVGWDEYRRATNPSNPLALSTVVVGYRLITVTMRAKSWDAHLQAYEFLERVRWQLGGVTASQVYADENIAWVDDGAIAVIRGTSAGTRVRLDATMDVTFAALGGGFPDDDPGETIGTVNSGGSIPFTPQ